MDGAYFYWFTWMTWIFSTFLMKKSPLRMELAFISLLVIILTAHSFTIGNLTINVGMLFILFYGYFKIKNKSILKLIYFFIATLTITFGYVSFHLFEMIDPVWVFLDRKWLLSIGLVYFIILLQKNAKDRIICLIIGACQGELLYGLVIRNFNVPVDIGPLAFFDILSISFIMMLGWYSLERISANFDGALVQKTLKEKLKQS